MPSVTTYVKESDYEISVVRSDIVKKYESSYQPMYRESKISRTFNFMSRQITTVITEAVYQNSYHSTGYPAGHSEVQMKTEKENFRDLDSTDEIEYLYDKLRGLGGKPPSIDKILGQLPGRKTVLRETPVGRQSGS